MKENFSVSMCVYMGDNPEHFDTSLKSIFMQTLLPDEVVLVVDGPVSEETNNIIEKYQSGSAILNVIRLEKNVGHGNARREGLRNCKHDIVALMDADDICVPQRFEKQIQEFKEDPELDIVGGQITEFIGDVKNIVGVRNVPIEDGEIKEYMKKRCPMNQMTVMFKKTSVDSSGGYIDWFCEEDYYLWLRMAMNNMKFKNLPETLVNVRVGEEMYMRRGGVKYFKSEAKLQGFMLKNKIISFPRFVINVSQRLVLQVLMPNKIRGWVFKKFARNTEAKADE